MAQAPVQSIRIDNSRHFNVPITITHHHQTPMLGRSGGLPKHLIGGPSSVTSHGPRQGATSILPKSIV